MASQGRTSPSIGVPESSTFSRPTAKPQRVLACIRCQQRKIKCNRKFPCENCSIAKVQCVQAAPTQRQRRRRFAERELLDRLRHYENLLSQNRINFEPMHAPNGARLDSEDGKDVDHMEDSPSEKQLAQGDRLPDRTTSNRSETVYEPKYASTPSLLSLVGLTKSSQEPLACYESKGQAHYSMACTLLTRTTVARS